MKPTKRCDFRDVISVVSSQTRNGTYIMHVTRGTYIVHQSGIGLALYNGSRAPVGKKWLSQYLP